MSHNLQDFKSLDTVILLGAGASRGAQIPDNYGLNAAILAKLQKEYHYELFPAIFQFVISTMQAQKAATDPNDRQALNFEEVVSTIKLLAERDTLEIRPFLGSWDYRLDIFDGPQQTVVKTYTEILNTLMAQIKQIIAKAGSHIYKDIERVSMMDSFSRHLDKHGFDSTLSERDYDINRAIEDLAEKMADVAFRRQSIEGNFKRLYNVIHALLNDIMDIQNTDLVTYLSPLVNFKSPAEIDIFTLNYDTAIEVLCDKHKVAYSDGFTQDSNNPYETFTGNWATDSLRLYKLHGSISWRFDGKHLVEKSDSKEAFVPAIILGTRDKLRAEGPFLDILFEFKARLKSVQNVVVIGYSFGDAHINSYLEKWVREPGNKLTVVSGKNVDLPYSLQYQATNTQQTAESFLQLSH